MSGDYTVAPAISRIVDCVATHLSLDCRSRIDDRSCHIGGDMRLPFSPPCLVSSSVHVRPCCALHAMRMRRHRASTNIPHSPDSRKTWLEHHRCPPQYTHRHTRTARAGPESGGDVLNGMDGPGVILGSTPHRVQSRRLLAWTTPMVVRNARLILLSRLYFPPCYCAARNQAW